MPKAEHEARHSRGTESTLAFQAEASSIQKADRDVGWGLDSPKVGICTRLNIMGFYSCLLCVWAPFNRLLLGDTFGELCPTEVAHDLPFLALGITTEGFQPGSALTPSAPVASSAAF